MSLSGSPERSGPTGLPGVPLLAALCCGLAAAALACSTVPLPPPELPVVDDGACRRPLGDVHALWAGGTLGAASDGERTFFVDRKEGHLRVGRGEGPWSVLAPELVGTPDRVASGWLLLDRQFVYWVPGHVEGPRDSDLRLVRVPKGGGEAEKGFQPPGPVIAAHVDEWGGLLLTEEGLWRLDLRAWGKSRLIVPGQYSTFTADPGRAYLRPINEVGPLDLVANQVLHEGGCREPQSTSIVSVDRQTGTTSDLFASKELALFGPLVADETHLYSAAAPTAALSDEKNCRVRRLLRIGKDGKSVSSRVVPVGIGGDLVQQGGRLHWIDGHSGRVFATGKTGGPVVVTAQVPCRPNRMALAGSTLQVWRADGNECGLSSVPTSGEVASAVANLEVGDALLTVAGGWAYVADAEDRLRRISLAKGTVQPLRAGGTTPITAIQAAVAGQSLFFVGPDFLGRWSLATDELSRLFEGHTRALALDGDALYVATEDGAITFVDPGGRQTVIVGGGSPVRDMVVVNHGVYWTQATGSEGAAGGARALFTAGPARNRTQLLSVEGLDEIASDGWLLYFATEGRISVPNQGSAGAVMRLVDGLPSRLADRQERITDLRASRLGVFWRQRRGIRWVDPAGTLRGLDCTVADQGVGLVEADGAVFWADGTARALMTTRLPR